MMRIVFNKARANPKRIVLAEGDNEKMIRAAHQLVDEGLAHARAAGRQAVMRATALNLDLDLDGVHIVEPGDITGAEALMRGACTTCGIARA